MVNATARIRARRHDGNYHSVVMCIYDDRDGDDDQIMEPTHDDTMVVIVCEWMCSACVCACVCASAVVIFGIIIIIINNSAICVSKVVIGNAAPSGVCPLLSSPACTHCHVVIGNAAVCVCVCLCCRLGCNS